MTQALVTQNRELQILTQKFGSLLYGNSKQEDLVKLQILVQKGFDIQLGHLAAYEGRLHITKDGAHWWKHHNDPEVRYGVIWRPVKASEREDYGLKPDEVGAIAFVEDHRTVNPVTGEYAHVGQGFGKASGRPYTYVKDAPDARNHPDRKRNPVDAAHAMSMAAKRAESQAIMRSFPTGVDVDVMIDDGLTTGPRIRVMDGPMEAAAPGPTGPRAWANIGAFFTDAARAEPEGFGWDKTKVLGVLKMKSQADLVDLPAAWRDLDVAYRHEKNAALDAQAAAEAGQ